MDKQRPSDKRRREPSMGEKNPDVAAQATRLLGLYRQLSESYTAKCSDSQNYKNETGDSSNQTSNCARRKSRWSGAMQIKRPTSNIFARLSRGVKGNGWYCWEPGGALSWGSRKSPAEWKTLSIIGCLIFPNWNSVPSCVKTDIHFGFPDKWDLCSSIFLNTVWSTIIINLYAPSPWGMGCCALSKPMEKNAVRTSPHCVDSPHGPWRLSWTPRTAKETRGMATIVGEWKRWCWDSCGWRIRPRLRAALI